MAKRPTAPISAGERAEMPIVCPPERQDISRLAYTLGYLCRAIVLFFAVLGLALFVCDAFLFTEAHSGPLSVSTLMLMSAVAVAYFALLYAGRLWRWITIGLSVIGLILLLTTAPIAQLANILVQSLIRTVNLCLTRLITLGYGSMQNLLIPQENVSISPQRAILVSTAVLVFLLAAVFVPCLIARTRLLRPALTGSALLILVFVFNICQLNWGFALIIASFSAILVLAAFDRRYLHTHKDCDNETQLLLDTEDKPTPLPMPPHLAAAAGRRAAKKALRRAPTVDQEIAYYTGTKREDKNTAPVSAQERRAAREYYASLRAVRRYTRRKERRRIATGGFAGAAVLCIALILLVLPVSLTEQDFSEIDFINRPMETARRFVTAYLAGDSPVLNELLYAGQLANSEPHSTDASRRQFTGEPIFEIETQYAANLYLRGWVATKYSDGMWHSANEKEISLYRRDFGTSTLVSEQMRVNFYRAVDPDVLNYTDYIKYYQNHLERGFITMQVNMRRIGGAANMVFAPAYLNPEIGLVNYATGDPSDLSYINYYDGIYTGRDFMSGAEYGAVSFVTSMRDSGFIDTLSTDIEAYTRASRAARIAWLMLATLKMGEVAFYDDGGFALEISYEERGYTGVIYGDLGRYDSKAAAADIEKKANEIFTRFLNMTEYEREQLEAAWALEERYRSHVYDTYINSPISTIVREAVDEAVSTATQTMLEETAKNESDSRTAAAYSARHSAVIEIVQWLSEWVETDELDAEGNPISRRRFNYTLDPTVPLDPTLDGVDNFLLVTHEGYCVQFASAVVLMLRSLGIPARYVEGYIATDFTKASTESSQRYITIVRDNNAHAWVEVYYDGIGWLNYEATPAYVGDMYAFGSGDTTNPNASPAEPEIPAEPERDIFETMDLDELLRLEREQAEREARERLIRTIVTWLIGLSILLLLIMTVCLILHRTHRADKHRLALLTAVQCGFPEDDGGRMAARDAAKRLINEVEHLFVIMHLAPAMGEQRSAYAARLAPEFGPLCPISLETLFDAIGAEEFGSGMTDDALRALGIFREALGQTARKRIGFGRRLFYRYIKHLL